MTTARARGRRFLIIGGLATCALAVLLAILYAVRNLEHAPLDDAARRGAPGSFVRLADGVTHYELTGPNTARTVVLLSGMSVPYYLWDPTHDALAAAGYRVLRYDYYGRGLSDRPDVEYDLNTYDRQLNELLDTLRIRGPIDLAGVSMGGVVAADFATKHPEHVRSLILVDPGFATVPSTPFPFSVPGLGEYAMTMLAPVLANGQSDDFLHPERYPDWVPRYREQMRYHGFRRALLRTMRGDAMRPSASAFTGLRGGNVPILLIWGREDHTVPFARSVAVRQAFPRAEFHAIDSAGHLPHYERAEIVDTLLLQFLRVR